MHLALMTYRLALWSALTEIRCVRENINHRAQNKPICKPTCLTDCVVRNSVTALIWVKFRSYLQKLAIGLYLSFVYQLTKLMHCHLAESEVLDFCSAFATEVRSQKRYLLAMSTSHVSFAFKNISSQFNDVCKHGAFTTSTDGGFL